MFSSASRCSLWDGGSVVSTVFVVVFCVVLVPTIVVGVLLRWGQAVPRFGRWLDGKIYRLFPRLGHLFVEDQEEDQGSIS